MRVLISDDDPVYRKLLQDLLTEWHFEVVLATDGLEALELMRRENAPSLLLVDWEMPGMDGFELTRTIRSENNSSGIYIVMITGSRHKQDLMKVVVSGADDYLLKPFDPMDLKIHLRNAMRVLRLQEEVSELTCALKEGNHVSP